MSEEFPTGYPLEFDHGITVGQYESEDDGAHLVWIDTQENTGHIRVYLNDGDIPLYDGDPEKVDHPLMALRKEFEPMIIAALNDIDGSTEADSMDEVFAARDDAGDLLSVILTRLKEATS
jgi:hypothetical protein